MTRGERGAASLLVASCLTLLLVLGSALGVVAAVLRAHRLAQSAADLAALAGAAERRGGHDPCAAAARIARANGATLVGCRLAGADVTVTVTVTGPRWLGQTADLRGHARAGPG